MKSGKMYSDFIWGKESFSKLLEEELIWDVNKYWKLELFLIKLIQDEFSSSIVDKELSAELYYLSRFIDKCVYSTINPNDVWNIENLNEEDLFFYYDRFNYLMRILWGRIKFELDDYFFYQNPLYMKDAHLAVVN